MKIAVSSYSYAQYVRAGKMDYFDTVNKAKEMGFDGIEFAGLPADIEGKENRLEFASKLREYAAKTGIEVVAYLIPGSFVKETKEELEAEVARLKGEVDIAVALGVSLMRHDIMPKLPKYRTFDSVVKEIAPAIREVTEYAASVGVKTMFENHGRVLQDYDRVEKIINEVGHSNFGLLIDIGNFMCCDLDNVTCVARLANLAVHVHLKDFRRFDYDTNYLLKNALNTRGQNKLIGCAVGAGDARSAQCLSILHAQGYDGYLSLEYEGPEDCIEGIQQGLDFYRNWEVKNV